MPTLFRWVFVTCAGIACAFSQSLASRVLVVHNSAVPESVLVADHYVQQRSIPAANRCAITSASTDFISLDQYRRAIQTPIRACLNTAGAGNILYIVLTYGVPYGIYERRRYALDSFVADIWDRYTTRLFTSPPNATQGYYVDAQAEGGYYPAFVPLASYRTNRDAMLIYSVWRLDGPNSALAMGLVDKAIAAEQAGGPSGQSCFDWRYPVAGIADLGAGNGEWDIFRASDFVQQAGIPTTVDSEPPEITSCPNAALYSGWYSLFYSDVFTWNTGAIGWHLDSASAYDPRGGTSWAPNAVARGITVTTGAIDEPYLQGMVRPSGAFRNLLEGANVGDAFLRNTRWLKWMILYYGDPLYRPFPGGKAPFNSGMGSNYFLIENPRALVAGVQTLNATIGIASPAPAGGLTFGFGEYYSGLVARTPATVTIPEGGTSVTFPISALHRTYELNDIIYAESGTLKLRNSITALTLLAAVRVQIATVTGGTALLGSVVLNAATGREGATVALTSDNPAVAVPASVTVPSGASNVVFVIGTGGVSESVNVTITATHEGATASTILRVTP